MSLVHATPNTDKDWPCVHCGSQSFNIVREAQGGNPARLKCNVCNGMYDSTDSEAAKEADAIPDPANPPAVREPELVDNAASNPRVATPNPRDAKSDPNPETERVRSVAPLSSIPRSPDYVLIAKNRQAVEYVTKKNLKKAILKWEAEEVNYDLYELKATQAAVKVEFEGKD